MKTGNDAIEVEDVWLWYPHADSARPILRDVSVRIPGGQFISVVGASGCGKTTLLNVIAGSVTPGAGKVRVVFDGTKEATPSKQVGYMFARDALLPWRSARSNVEIALELRGIGREQRRRRAVEMLELVGLAGHDDKVPSQLSQGMRQRAGLARILAFQPRLLLLDEPFGALDAQTKAILQGEFLRIWERERPTVVFVTHDLAEAALLSDRVIVMRAGRIVEDIAVPFERPRNLDELRFDPQYSALTHHLWRHISES